LLEAHPESLTKLVSGESTFTLAWTEPTGSALLADAADESVVGTTAEESGGAWKLSGEKTLVPDLGTASHVLVTAKAAGGVGIWLVEKEGGASLSTLDTTRRYGKLQLEGTAGTLILPPGEAADPLRRMRLRALSALAVEAVGIGQKALELSIEHAKERTQFGKPIGSYQAVSHQVANSYVAVELARSLAYWAAWCVAEADDQAEVAAAAAKAVAAEAAVEGSERAIQVLGGIGFTWEHLAHRLYKRAQWIDAFEGSGTTHRAHVADKILA
jgi:acyl-CoA dehydrogenase